MFVGYNRRLIDEHKLFLSAYTLCSSTNIADFSIGIFLKSVKKSMNIIAMFVHIGYVRRCHITDEHKLCSSAPMNIWSYVRLLMSAGYDRRLIDEHKLFSSAYTLCSSVFGRQALLIFL
jgi:hypothetical protein